MPFPIRRAQGHLVRVDSDGVVGLGAIHCNLLVQDRMTILDIDMGGSTIPIDAIGKGRLSAGIESLLSGLVLVLHD